MGRPIVVDNALSILAISFTAGGSTSFTVGTGDGPRFGDPSVDHPIRLTLIKASALGGGMLVDVGQHAIYRATSRVGDVLSGLTFESGVEQNFGVGDVIGVLVIAETINELSTDLEAVEDALAGGVGITTEDAQDATAAMIAAGTHTGITFAYNDAANSLSATVTGGGGGGMAIGGAVTGGTVGQHLYVAAGPVLAQTASPTITGILHGSNATGANVVGSPLVLAGGTSTGDAAGGLIQLQVSSAGGVGSGVNALADAMTIDSNKDVRLFGAIRNPLRLRTPTIGTNNVLVIADINDTATWILTYLDSDGSLRLGSVANYSFAMPGGKLLVSILPGFGSAGAQFEVKSLGAWPILALYPSGSNTAVFVIDQNGVPIFPQVADANIPAGGIAWSTTTPDALKCKTPAGVLKTITLT